MNALTNLGLRLLKTIRNEEHSQSNWTKTVEIRGNKKKLDVNRAYSKKT